MVLLQTADVAKQSTFLCGLAKLMEEKTNNIWYGIECNGDPSARIKEINAYVWLTKNPDCEICDNLYCAFNACYAELVGSIYSCSKQDPCSSTEINMCQLVAVDENNNPPNCTLTSIEILK